jgi:hypothetical protein
MNKQKYRKSGKGFSKLTRIQAETLRFLTEEFLTINKVAIRRGVSNKAVYQTIKQLKQKGLLSKSYKSIENIQSTIQGNARFRLHGLEFNIQILHLSELYKKIRKKANHILIDGNTVRLYNNSLEVYCSKSFFGDSVQKVTKDSAVYINRLFLRLENEFKIIIVKDRTQNIRIVNAHYSEINNSLAKECNIKKERIKVYSNDGKLWFLIDNSFNLNEAETVNPKTSKVDMEEVVAPFFNDLRENEAVTMSEIKHLLFLVIKENKDTATGLNSVVQILKAQMQPIQQEEGLPKSKPDYVG